MDFNRYSMQKLIDYMLWSQGWRSSIQSAKTRPGADCGSNHVLLIAKFRLNLKKMVQTTRPFRYDLNQISYDYTVEVTNRFKGLDLVNCMPGEMWTEVWNIVQEAVKKPIPKGGKKKKQKGKVVIWRGFTNSWRKKRSKSKGEGERCIQLNAEFQRTVRREKKAFFHEQCIKIEETNIRRKTRTFFRKIGNSKGTFHPMMGTIKDRECRDLVQKRS